MKLAALGVVTVAIGLALSAPGLVGVGAFWVVMGVIARLLAPRMTLPRRAAPTAPAVPAQGSTPSNGRKFALGVVVLLAVGVPSLVVGLLEVGFDDDVAAWRWLPIGVGALGTGLGLVSGLLYAAGAGVSAAAGTTGGSIPATLWIRSMKETGQYINERPRLEFVFLVQPDQPSEIGEFEVVKRATVPFTAVGSLRVGDGFRAQVVGPEDPDAMTIDWDSPVRSGSAAAEPADITDRLDELERLRREEVITDEEYQAQRGRILGSL